MRAPREHAIIALRQWVIFHGGVRPILDHVVLDTPLTPATAPAFLNALPAFREILAKSDNSRPVNAHHRLVDA